MTIPRTWQATLLLIGTIIGAGMFGIPFVFQEAGFLTGALELAVLAAATALVHLAYAEVVLATGEIHRLPGYAALYLGRRFGLLAAFSYLFGLSGTLLAYLVLGGFFLGQLLSSAFPILPAEAGPLFFYLLGIGVIFRSIRFESLTNAVLTLTLVMAIIVMAFTLLPAVSASSFGVFRLDRLSVPYGAVLFSMAGAAVIPDMRRILAGQEISRFRRLVVWGTIVPAFLYFLFAAAVVGVSNSAVTPDAVSGLASRFGSVYMLAGSLIGFLAAITSFITLGLVLEGMFVSDFGIKPRAAWLLTAVIPAGFFLLGFQDFITIISLVGAVGIGLDSILILLVHRRAALGELRPGRAAALGAGVPAFRFQLPAPARLILLLIFLLGIGYEFFTFF